MQIALELGIPVTAIDEAVFARAISVQADPARASRQLPGADQPGPRSDEAERFADLVEQALYASKVIAYDPGLGR